MTVFYLTTRRLPGPPYTTSVSAKLITASRVRSTTSCHLGRVHLCGPRRAGPAGVA
jgi:hypothetical protein